FRMLQFNDDKIRLLINPEQINAPTTFLPLAKFFSNDQRVGTNDVDLFSKHPLKVTTLLKSCVNKSNSAYRDDGFFGQLIQRHGRLNLLPGVALQRIARGFRVAVK